MKKKIKLYLISGFLGSGKTTFMKQLLTQYEDKKIGVLINEFGSIGIDGVVLRNDDIKMVEINNGSIFCACLKGGFVKTLVAFLEQPIDILFIEASGMADPTSMNQLLESLEPILERNADIQSQYDYRGSICLVDAGRFLDLYEMFQPTMNQVIKSSLIVLNKMDEVSKENEQELFCVLKELNPSAQIYPTTFGQVDYDVIDEHIHAREDWNIDTTNTIFNRPVTYILTMKGKYELEKMKQFASNMASYVLRLKGFFVSTDGKMMHADCVSDYVQISEKEVLNGSEQFALILIGKNGEDYGEALHSEWNAVFSDQEIIAKKDE